MERELRMLTKNFGILRMSSEHSTAPPSLRAEDWGGSGGVTASTPEVETQAMARGELRTTYKVPAVLPSAPDERGLSTVPTHSVSINSSRSTYYGTTIIRCIVRLHKKLVAFAVNEQETRCFIEEKQAGRDLIARHRLSPVSAKISTPAASSSDYHTHSRNLKHVPQRTGPAPANNGPKLPLRGKLSKFENKRRLSPPGNIGDTESRGTTLMTPGALRLDTDHPRDLPIETGYLGSVKRGTEYPPVEEDDDPRVVRLGVDKFSDYMRC
ncbi:hypothetical protein WH47_10944 [Habropoda laboriosa]|uniref:Uncharacterized protein n=1 Tax=Habropoda laboriosa TaxID=597456 RepID=A0A0L7R9E3_9HYME|nr:hypothetical protein WH47_10944 [Habropoda laboriosa]